MRANNVPGKKVRSARRPQAVTADVLSVCSPGWSLARANGARAGSVAAVIAGILGTAAFGVVPAHAQNAAAGTQAAPPAGSAQTSQSLQQVVVTATASRVTQLDASYNVTTADDELIKESNPLSAADILKLSPGIWAESSGGETGLNTYVAGFPSGGDSPFFTNMIMGMPVYGSPNLGYLDTASFLRLDDTIQRLEVVQGGPAAVFGPGQMGGTANYIPKTGDTSAGGTVSATYGTEGLWRGDAYYGFTIADGWYGSVGGFYRESKGVRESQFPADQGGQFTATLKHDLDGGSITFWGRVLDDKDQYITGFPLLESTPGNFTAYPGFNPLTSTFNGYGTQNVTLNNPMGGFLSSNLANGRGSQLYFLGSDYNQHVGAWTLHNGFLIDGGGMDTNGWFSGPNPRPLSMFLYGCNYPEPAGWCGGANGTTPIDKNNLNGGNGYPFSQDIQALYAGSGQAVPLSTNVIEQSYHFIQHSVQSITDEFRVSRDLFQGDTVTAGVYLADYTDNEVSIADQALMTAAPNASTITLSYVDKSGNINNLTSPQGFVNDNGTYTTPVQHGDGRNVAPYFSDSWHEGPWLADVGARLEYIDERQRTCNTSNELLGTQYDLWDNSVPVCNGTWDYEHYTHTMPTFTGGLNYEFSHNMSAYVRANTGNHFANFSDIAYAHKNPPYAYPPVETIRNYELGFKFQSSISFVDISAYHRTFDGIRYQATTIEGVNIPGEYGEYGALSNGVDVNGYITPFKGFTVRVVGDYMAGHYDHDNACLQYTNLFGVQECASINGAPLQRQPKFQIRVTPSYFAATPWGDVTAWLTYEHVGQRYSDLAGTQPLGTYNMLSAGLVADLGTKWQFRVQGTNLTNAIALTEGNARVTGGEVGVGDVVIARPYEGREVNFTAGYNF